MAVEMKPKWIIALVVLVLLLIFLFQNTQVVTLKLFFWSISMSRIILISIFLIVGFAAGYAAAKISGKKSGSRTRRI